MKNASLVQVNVVPPQFHPALSIRDYAALGLYASALLFEITADRQKAAWRRAQENKEHEEKFITSGLWGISRHPKYYYLRFLIASSPCSDNTFLAMSAK
jgi:steroid 5-alpha reductase family enzyme